MYACHTGVMDDETEKYLTGRPGVNWFRCGLQHTRRPLKLDLFHITTRVGCLLQPAISAEIWFCSNLLSSKFQNWWAACYYLQSLRQTYDFVRACADLSCCCSNISQNQIKPKRMCGTLCCRVNIQIPESQAKTHPANRVSTIKYTLLKDFLQMGYNVLITVCVLCPTSNECISSIEHVAEGSVQAKPQLYS